MSLKCIRTKIYFREQKTVGGPLEGPHCIPRKLSLFQQPVNPFRVQTFINFKVLIGLEGKINSNIKNHFRS